MNNIEWTNGTEHIIDINRCNSGDCSGCERQHNASCGDLMSLTPDAHLTGEKIKTPRGSFFLADMTVEQMKEAGYSFYHQSDDGKYAIMTSNNCAYAVAVDPPEKVNPLKQ